MIDTQREGERPRDSERGNKTEREREWGHSSETVKVRVGERENEVSK